MDTDAADIAYFIDRALDGMVAIITELGDERANQKPDLEGANSPYSILTHCLGVMNYWDGYVAVGRPITRNREAEFRATGTVADLVSQVESAKRQLRDDLSRAALADRVTNVPGSDYDSPREELLQGTVFLHVIEELCQHHGQMEITRDVIVRSQS
jgi:Protein of unknown function (DUF664)